MINNRSHHLFLNNVSYTTIENIVLQIYHLHFMTCHITYSIPNNYAESSTIDRATTLKYHPISQTVSQHFSIYKLQSGQSWHHIPSTILFRCQSWILLIKKGFIHDSIAFYKSNVFMINTLCNFSFLDWVNQKNLTYTVFQFLYSRYTISLSRSKSK